MANLSEAEVFGKQPPLKATVDELESLFPQINPSPRDSDREIMYRAGQRSVVEFLLEKLNDERS